MSYLKELNDSIDSHPFTEIRTIPETKVVCRGSSLPDSAFRPTSMLGKSREDYYESLAEYGLTPDKEYTAIKVEGYGDVYDIYIKENDYGLELQYMSIMFDIPE